MEVNSLLELHGGRYRLLAVEGVAVQSFCTLQPILLFALF